MLSRRKFNGKGSRAIFHFQQQNSQTYFSMRLKRKATPGDVEIVCLNILFKGSIFLLARSCRVKRRREASETAGFQLALHSSVPQLQMKGWEMLSQRPF